MIQARQYKLFLTAIKAQNYELMKRHESKHWKCKEIKKNIVTWTLYNQRENKNVEISYEHTYRSAWTSSDEGEYIKEELAEVHREIMKVYYAESEPPKPYTDRVWVIKGKL